MRLSRDLELDFMAKYRGISKNEAIERIEKDLKYGKSLFSPRIFEAAFPMTHEKTSDEVFNEIENGFTCERSTEPVMYRIKMECKL